MYCGIHGLTILELPDGEVLYSRDLYANLRVQSVIEIASKGKFIVYQNHMKFSQEEPIPEEPQLQPPCQLTRLQLRSGDFQNVETDLHYIIGTDLRPEVKEERPEFKVTVDPPEFFQVPLREAKKLYAETMAAVAGRLSDSTRLRLIGATVYIQSFYSFNGQIVSATGSGFVISPHGYIVTNEHVVQSTIVHPQFQQSGNLDHVDVTLFSGQTGESTRRATILKHGAQNFDLALLKIDGEGLDFLCIENEPVSELEPVIAVGYPGGQMLSFTGANPTVSFRGGQITAIRGASLKDNFLYEHSAPIEQGNSGGPLVTPRGNVVGVNTFLSGPQKQSRFAISKDSLEGFFFQETAEGKGPYKGPASHEEYALLIASINIIWQILDSHLHQVVVEGLVRHFNETDAKMSIDQVESVLADSVETLNYLLQVLDTAQPTATHRLTHSKIREGFRVQLEAADKMLRLLSSDADDQLTGPGKAQRDSRTQHEKHNEFGSLSNDIQAGRTLLCFAVNRIIGQFYPSVLEEVKTPGPPIGPITTMDKYEPAQERGILNEIGNILQRHRGDRVLILRVNVQEQWRSVVYKDALVSGSDAMMREINSVFAGASPAN